MLSSIIIAKTILPVLLCLQAPDQESIDVLIKKLGSPNFKEREVATKQLLKKWPEAVPALEKALQSPDEETAKRAALILKEFDQLPLKKLERFVQEGKVDQATELLARWPKGKYEAACWQAARELTCKVAEFYKNANRGIDIKLLKGAKAAPVVVNAKLFTKEMNMKYRDTFLFARAEKVDLDLKSKSVNDILFFSSGDVRICPSAFEKNAVFTCGSVQIDWADDSIIVSDGDVTLKKFVHNCVIIARGNVTCESRIIDCLIISGKSVTRRSKVEVNCTVIENEKKPLGFIQFFDPAQVGIEVEAAKDSVRIKKLDLAKIFAKAGLQSGDVLLSLDKNPVKSVEGFRKQLRHSLAVQPQLSFEVRRAEKTVTISVKNPG